MSNISQHEDVDMNSILSLLNDEKSTDITRYEKPTQNIGYNNQKLENVTSHKRSSLTQPDGDKTKKVSFDSNRLFKREEQRKDEVHNKNGDHANEKASHKYIERDALTKDEKIRNHESRSNEIQTTPTFDIDELLGIANGSNDISTNTHERGSRHHESIETFQNYHGIKLGEGVIRQSNQSREMNQSYDALQSLPKFEDIDDQKNTSDEVGDNSQSRNIDEQAQKNVNFDKVDADSANDYLEKPADALDSFRSDVYKLGDSQISMNHENYARSDDNIIQPLNKSAQNWHQDSAKTDQRVQHEKNKHQQTRPDYLSGNLSDKLEKVTEDNRYLREVLKEKEYDNQTKGRRIEDLLKKINELKTRLSDVDQTRVALQEVVSGNGKMRMPKSEHQLDSKKIMDEWKVVIATKLKEYQNGMTDNVLEALSRHKEIVISKQESLSKVNEKQLAETTKRVEEIKIILKELQIGFESSKDTMNIIIDSNANTHRKILKEIQELLSSLDDTRISSYTNMQDILGSVDKKVNGIIEQKIAEKERLEKEHERLISLQLFMETERREMVKMQDRERAKLVEKATLLDISRKNKEREYDIKKFDLENTRKELILRDEALIASQEELEEERKSFMTESRKDKEKIQLIITKLNEDECILEDSRKQIQSEFAEIERRKQEIIVSEKKIEEKQTRLHEMAENLSQFSKFLKLKEENAQDKLFWAKVLKVDTEKAFSEVAKQKQEIEKERLAFTNHTLELKQLKKAIIKQRIVLLDERSKSRTLEKNTENISI